MPSAQVMLLAASARIYRDLNKNPSRPGQDLQLWCVGTLLGAGTGRYFR